MMNNVSIGEGHRESPARCVDQAAAAICQQGCGGSSSNPDAEVVPPASDSIGLGCDAANATIGADRSAEDSWRVAIHESGHVLVHRHLNHEICGVSIVPDGKYSGKTWGPQGNVHAAAVWGPECVARLADSGVSGDGDVNGLFSGVQAGVMGLMAGCAAEMTFLGSGPPRYIGSDVPRASDLAGYVCRTTASIEAFIEFCYQESLAIVEQHKTIVLAIARALIDHPNRTLDGAEIDAVIVPALAAKAAADEHKRRADWAKVLTNAAEFTARETQSED
jgi:hypothetical protein